MKRLQDLIAGSEDWLMRRVIYYARERLTGYTSTLEEAWRISVARLSESLLASLNLNQVRDPGPEGEYKSDSATAFAVLQARRHRDRGIDPGMFLGLLRQATATLVSPI